MKNKGFNDDIWDETEKRTVQMEAKNRAKSYMNSAEIVFKTAGTVTFNNFVSISENTTETLTFKA